MHGPGVSTRSNRAAADHQTLFTDRTLTVQNGFALLQDQSFVLAVEIFSPLTTSLTGCTRKAAHHLHASRCETLISFATAIPCIAPHLSFTNRSLPVSFSLIAVLLYTQIRMWTIFAKMDKWSQLKSRKRISKLSASPLMTRLYIKVVLGPAVCVESARVAGLTPTLFSPIALSLKMGTAADDNEFARRYERRSCCLEAMLQDGSKCPVIGRRLHSCRRYRGDRLSAVVGATREAQLSSNGACLPQSRNRSMRFCLIYTGHWSISK